MTVRTRATLAFGAAFLAAVCAGPGGARAGEAPIGRDADASTGKVAVAAVLSRYQDALNASSARAVMPLYMEDGVFMPPYSQSAVGKAALRQAYDAVFKAITLHVRFKLAEVVQVAPGWAFARTNSAGTSTVNATGAQSAEANQELFIFHRGADGKWRIARYSFSTTNPPHAS